MASECLYNRDFFEHKCQLWEEGHPANPEGCDEQGQCSADGDDDPSWCQSYEPLYDDDVCDYCGEPLGFCAIDCETREEDFDE